MDLKNLNVLITGGGGSGVGGGICEALAGFGATLVINDLDIEKAKTAAEKYPKAIAVGADISKGEKVAQMFEEIKERVGPVNGLVNNAGVGLSRLAHEASEAEFDHLYNIDIRAVWQVSKFFVNQLLANKITGNIVNVSSVHAHATQPRYALYCSAKSAVQGLTKGMAYELGHFNIRCNAIGPGLVKAEQNYELIKTWADDPRQWETDFVNYQQAIPKNIYPVDCGNTVAFLLSDYSAAITGQTIYVDAGTTVMIHNRDFVEGRK